MPTATMNANRFMGVQYSRSDAWPISGNNPGNRHAVGIDDGAGRAAARRNSRARRRLRARLRRPLLERRQRRALHSERRQHGRRRRKPFAACGRLRGVGRRRENQTRTRLRLPAGQDASREIWIPFRDVFEVDGKPVRNRGDRLTKLFLQPPDGDSTGPAHRWRERALQHRTEPDDQYSGPGARGVASDEPAAVPHSSAAARTNRSGPECS